MITFFNSQKSPITVVTAIIILAGAFAYTKMQTSLFPEITFPKIKIIADAGQLPVDNMMVSVTRPIENAVKQVPDLKLIRSITSRGSCELSLFLDWKADLDIGQQRIEAKINEIRSTLPASTQIIVERMNPSILPVLGYTLESKYMSQIDLKILATYIIKPFLSQVDGVSEIRIIGGKTREYWLELNTQKMSTLGVTPDIISSAINQANFVKSNGYLSDYRIMYLTVTDVLARTKEDIENIAVNTVNRRIIQLKDIAQIKIHEAKEYVKINANGKEAILITAIKQPNANLIELSNNMEKKVEELRKVIPKGVDVQPFYIQADFVNDSVRGVTDSLWIGLALAVIVAVLFLRSFTASITMLLTIPVTLGLTLIVLMVMGETFNIMTLGAIAAAIGLIIDDAIVVIEQIHRTHEENSNSSPTELVKKGIRYLFPAMAGSSLSTIVIFLPFLFMSGVAGAYFKVMTNTMMIILICSFFITWIILPVIFLLLSKDEPEEESQIRKEKTHLMTVQKWVMFFVKRPYISVVIVVILIFCIYIIPSNLQTGFLPDMDEGSIVLDYASPPGTSLEETDRMLKEVEKIIVEAPEVETYSRRTGTQMGFFITEPNTGDYLIQLKKDRSRTSADVIDELRAKIESTQPALRIDFGQVIGDMLGDLMSSVQPVEVKIFGNDRKKLQQISKEVADIVSNVKGAADVFDGIVIAGPSISIKPRQDELSLYGISPSNFQYQVQTALEGNVTGSVFEENRLSDVRLIYPGNTYLSVNSIKNLQIFLPNGKLKPITGFADVNILGGDAEIERENLQPMGVVTARLENRDLGGVMDDIQRDVSAKLKLPAGYYIVYGGAHAEQQQSFKELLLILFTSSLLVFCIIIFLFKDFKIAFLIIFLALTGIAGSFIALLITNTPLNVGSYTGLIMIVGIIGENAIFTILQFRELLRSGSNADEAITSAVAIRLRPNLMTALGAIAALMPIALGLGTGTQLHRPLAIAVIGGFVFALPLLSIVLPSFLRTIYKEKSEI